MSSINIRFSEDIHKFLTEEASRLGISKNALIMVALNNYREEQIKLNSKSDLLDKDCNDK